VENSYLLKESYSAKDQPEPITKVKYQPLCTGESVGAWISRGAPVPDAGQTCFLCLGNICFVGGLVISVGQCQTFQQHRFIDRVCVLHWPACSSDLSYWKRMMHHQEENQTTMPTDTDSNENLQQLAISIHKKGWWNTCFLLTFECVGATNSTFMCRRF